MKLLKKLTSHDVCLLAIIILLLSFSCSDDNTFNDEDNDPTSQQDPKNGDPEKITENLLFKNATKRNGAIPTSTSSADLKIDRDTINLVEGLPPYIAIIKPENVELSKYFAQVEGSDTYFEAEFEDIENDTLVYLNFELDLKNLTQKTFSKASTNTSFTLKISPADNTNTAVKEFVIPVIAEAQRNNASGCTIEEFLDGKDAQTYYWYYTYDENLGESNDNFTFTAPSKSTNYTQSLSGCCDTNGVSSYSALGVCLGLTTEGIVEAISKFSTGLATLTFYSDGRVSGYYVNKNSQQPDVINTDYCNDVPAYLHNSTSNSYNGTYSLNTNDCTITINSLVSNDPNIWYIHSGRGSNTVYSKISEGILKEQRIDVETKDTLDFEQYYDRYKNL